MPPRRGAPSAWYRTPGANAGPVPVCATMPAPFATCWRKPPGPHHGPPMHPDPHRATTDPLEEAHRRRRIILVVAALVTGAIVVGVGMMALVVAFVPGGFVDSSFVNETDEDLVIYVNGEAQAVAGGGATVNNFALFPSEEAEAAARYARAGRTPSTSSGRVAPSTGAARTSSATAPSTPGPSSPRLTGTTPITANAVEGQQFGDVPLHACP